MLKPILASLLVIPLMCTSAASAQSNSQEDPQGCPYAQLRSFSDEKIRAGLANRKAREEVEAAQKDFQASLKEAGLDNTGREKQVAKEIASVLWDTAKQVYEATAEGGEIAFSAVVITELKKEIDSEVHKESSIAPYSIERTGIALSKADAKQEKTADDFFLAMHAHDRLLEKMRATGCKAVQETDKLQNAGDNPELLDKPATDPGNAISGDDDSQPIQQVCALLGSCK